MTDHDPHRDPDPAEAPLPPAEAMWRTAMEHVLALHGPDRQAHARLQAQAWRAADPAHEAMFAEAERVWGIAGAAGEGQFRNPLQRGGCIMSRRHLFAGGGAAAAGIAGITLLPGAMRWLRDEQTTGTAEFRDVEFPGGVRITLGPRSALRPLADDSGGDVELVDGFAFVEIPSQADRPLGLRAGSLALRSQDGVFELRHGSRNSFVAVGRGSVTVSGAGSGAARVLHPGEWLALSGPKAAPVTGHSDPGQVGQWRDGLLTVENRPIRDVAADIARWRRGRVVVLDDRLGDRAVSGLFDLARPDAALLAMVQPFGGHIRHLTPWLVLLDIG